METESPDLWKVAYVLPLHKGGQSNELNNYQPLSKLLCLTCKGENGKRSGESILISTPHFKILTGFGLGHSDVTVMAALKALNDAASALDNKQNCVALFVDLSKAFDTVDHQILSKYLESVVVGLEIPQW